MRGRKPSPTQLKLVRGNPGKRPIRAAGEPKPGHTLPEAPVHLSARAKAAWGQIAPILSRMGVLTEADAVALELLCEAYADYSEARDELRAFGSNYYETTTRQGRPCDGCIPPYRSCRRPIAVSAIGRVRPDPVGPISDPNHCAAAEERSGKEVFLLLTLP